MSAALTHDRRSTGAGPGDVAGLAHPHLLRGPVSVRAGSANPVDQELER